MNPPWPDPQSWAAVNDAIGYLLDRQTLQISHLHSLADSIRTQLTALYPVMDDLCRLSCPWCPTPCCISARIWYDTRDLLFFHLAAIPVAPGQPNADGNQTCRYLGPVGCRLDRLARPWICTWYICPPQKACLRKQGRGRLEWLETRIARIQTDRKNLETEFIRMTAGR